MIAWILMMAGMYTPDPAAARRGASKMARYLHWSWLVSDALRYGVYALVAGLLAIVLR